MGCTSSSLTMTDLPSAVIPVTILRIVRSSFAYWAAAPSVFPLPADLVQPHRVLEAPERRLSPVGEQEVLALGQFPNNVGYEYLAARRRRRDPRRLNDCRPVEILLLRYRLPRVQPYSYQYRFRC